MKYLLLPALLLCLIMAGCSSPFKLIVHNDTKESINVVVKWSEPARGGEQRVRTAEYRLQPGAQQEELVWFGEAPEQFRVSTRGAKRTQRTYTRKDYPDAMLGRSSMGPRCHLRITPSSWTLTGPTQSDRLQESLPLYLAGFLCCGGPVALLVWAEQRRWKTTLREQHRRLPPSDA